MSEAPFDMLALSGWTGCIQHRPGCEFCRARDMFAQHPDLIDLEANVLFWCGEEDAA